MLFAFLQGSGPSLEEEEHVLSGTNGNTHFGVPEIAFYWINFKNIIALLQQAALLRGCPFWQGRTFGQG